jgi:hypothetical protein
MEKMDDAIKYTYTTEPLKVKGEFKIPLNHRKKYITLKKE